MLRKFANTKLDMRADWVVCALFVIIVLIVNFDVATNITTTTYNFEDNIGYAYRASAIGDSISLFLNGSTLNPFKGLSETGIQVLSPFQEISCGSFYSVGLLNPITCINIVIILNYFLSLFFTYKLLMYMFSDEASAFLGSIIFGFSSLAIYVTWFNLAGFCLIPLLLLYILKYIDRGRSNDLLFVMLVTAVISSTSTYYIPYPFILFFVVSIFKIDNLKRLLRIAISIILGVIIASAFYLVPLYASSSGLESVGATISGSKLSERGNDISTLIHTNTFNEIVKYPYVKLLPTLPYFRYSTYFGFVTLVLLLSAIFIGLRLKSIYVYIGVVLLLVSIVLYAGEYLIFFGHDTGIPLPFHFIHYFHFGNILRKSIYFLHGAFLATAIIVSFMISTLPKKNRLILVSILVIAVLMENTFSFSRPTHNIPNRENLYAHINGRFLGLPNTNFVTNSILLDSQLYSSPKPFRYPDIFGIESEERIAETNKTPMPMGVVTRNSIQVYFGGNCVLDQLIFDITAGTCNFEKAVDDILKLEITEIVIYKKYVSDFFFNCNESCAFYIKAHDFILSHPENFEKVFEDDQGIIFKIQKTF